MGELVLRFVLGGLIVSLFAMTGEMFQPKTFAGLFGAAPSVAIATLAMAYVNQDGGYVAVEARSMLIGCAGLLVYGAACVATARRKRLPVWLGATLGWGAWAAVVLPAFVALRAVGALE
jgi:uncharacterized membrane protein (GlpM family)